MLDGPHSHYIFMVCLLEDCKHACVTNSLRLCVSDSVCAWKIFNLRPLDFTIKRPLYCVRGPTATSQQTVKSILWFIHQAQCIESWMFKENKALHCKIRFSNSLIEVSLRQLSVWRSVHEIIVQAAEINLMLCHADSPRTHWTATTKCDPYVQALSLFTASFFKDVKHNLLLQWLMYGAI